MSAADAILHQQITKLGETAGRIKEQRDNAHEALRDIIMGADMMLSTPPIPQGWIAHYIQEVKRVAQGGLS